MRYLFLLYGDEDGEQAMPQTEQRRIIEQHGAFAKRLREEGKYLAGAGLESSSSATVVRRGTDGRDDLITDGPFVEAKEQIGGLYLLECADLDEALRLAREIPLSPGLSVEVRPAPF